MGTHIKLESPGINGEGTKIFHNFSNCHNRCLHCAGDHQTKDCTTTWQWQTPTTNSPASGTGTSTHKNAPNTSHSSSHSNSQSPASHQHSQSTIHVQTPTLNINTPQFQPNLHQAPPPPLAQNNQGTIIQTNNKCTHHQHNHLIHSFHSRSTLRCHHHIFHNTHLLTVHLQIVLTLRSC